MRELDLGLRHDDEAMAPGSHQHRRNRRRRRTRGVLSALVVLAVLGGFAAVLIFGGMAVVHRLGRGAPDWAGTGAGSVIVQVHDGDSLTTVGHDLVAKGVVRSAGAFTQAAAHRADADKLQPGFYRLHQHMSAAAALDLLLDPASKVSTKVTVPEGATAAQIIAAIAAHSKIPAAGLTAALKEPSAIGVPGWAGGHAEGVLFPATYDLDPGAGAVDVLGAMTAKFTSVAGTLGLERGAQAMHVTPYDVVIIASIVEKEAKVPGDYPKVARVIYNRLAMGKPLEVDSTLEYVLPQRKGHLSNADIATKSAYNTYLHAGLPPTAIDSPGEVALRAALHPAAGNWIYFITVDKAGHTAFTASYQEFLRLKAKAQREGVY